jgi:hypothetical protein
MELRGSWPEQGHEVGGAAERGGASGGVQRWAFDLGDEALHVPDGITHLAFTAAPDTGGDASYERVYVRGLANVLAACDRQGIALERALFTSSTAVYADGPSVEATSPTAPIGTAAKLLEAEALVLARPGGVVPVLPASTDWLAAPGAHGPRGHGAARTRHRRQLTHRDDCAGAAATSPRCPRRAGVSARSSPVELARCTGGSRPSSAAPAARERRAGRPRPRRTSDARTRACGLRLPFRYPTYRAGYAEPLGP